MVGAVAVADRGKVDVVGRIGEHGHARRVPEIVRRRLTGRLSVADVVGIIPAEHRPVALGIGSSNVIDLVERGETLCSRAGKARCKGSRAPKGR